MIKTIIVITLLGCLIPAVRVQAQAGSDVIEHIKQLQRDSRKAEMNNDVAWAREHLADGYVAGNSWGAWQTRDEFIKGLESKAIQWKSGEVSDLRVAMFAPNVVVSHYAFTYEADFNGTLRARTVVLRTRVVPAFAVALRRVTRS